jgi:amino acid permease
MDRIKKFFTGSFLSSFAILIGTIIGAGIFGIPYVISKSGLIPGLAYFFVLGGVALLIHLLFGEIVLRTNGNKRVVGYAKQYLGEWGKIIILITTIVGLVGSLLAYAIISGDFLRSIFSILFPAIGFSSSFYFTVFFIIGLSFFIFRGMKAVAPLEVFTNIFFSLIIFAVFFFGLPKINLNNFLLFDREYMFLPFGVIMFSMIGWTAIPEALGLLKTSQEKKNLKKIIILGTIFPVFIYLIFSIMVLGVCGKNTSGETLRDLFRIWGRKLFFSGLWPRY